MAAMAVATALCTSRPLTPRLLPSSRETTRSTTPGICPSVPDSPKQLGYVLQSAGSSAAAAAAARQQSPPRPSSDYSSGGLPVFFEPVVHHFQPERSIRDFIGNRPAVQGQPVHTVGMERARRSGLMQVPREARRSASKRLSMKAETDLQVEPLLSGGGRLASRSSMRSSLPFKGSKESTQPIATDGSEASKTTLPLRSKKSLAGEPPARAETLPDLPSTTNSQIRAHRSSKRASTSSGLRQKEFGPAPNGSRPSSKDSRLTALRSTRASKELRNSRRSSEEARDSPIEEEEPVVVIEQAAPPPLESPTASHTKDLFVICQELNVPYALGREAAHLWRQHVPVAGDDLTKGRMPMKLFEELKGQQLAAEEAVCTTEEPDLEKKKDIRFPEFLQWFFTNGFRDELNIFDESTEQRYLKQVARTHGVTLLDVESIRLEFKKTDLDKNGVIDYEEFDVLIHSMMRLPDDEVLPHARMNTLWRDADSDNNGSLGFEEFMAFWMRSFAGDCPIEGFYRNFRRQLGTGIF